MLLGQDAPPSHVGRAIYSPAVFNLYDLLVLGISNRWISRCRTRRILRLYDEHVTDEHLDVGVGTGWYLDRCRLSTPRLGLLDPNANAPAKAAARVARYRSEPRRADVLLPIEPTGLPYRSMSLTYLLHCPPGTMREKAVAFDHLAALLRDDGVLFGATLLPNSVQTTRAARDLIDNLMTIYNKKGIFSNADDSLASLHQALSHALRDVRDRRQGMRGAVRRAQALPERVGAAARRLTEGRFRPVRTRHDRDVTNAGIRMGEPLANRRPGRPPPASKRRLGP